MESLARNEKDACVGTSRCLKLHMMHAACSSHTRQIPAQMDLHTMSSSYLHATKLCTSYDVCTAGRQLLSSRCKTMDLYEKRTCKSLDGTIIGYRQYGTGPGVVLVNGAMGVAQNYHQLATALADSFTVYSPDRRGRGMSNRKFTSDHTIER